MDNFIKRVRVTQNENNNNRNEFIEVKTSYINQNIKKKNLKLLLKYNKNLLKVKDLKEYEGNRINSMICLIVESITSYRDTFKLELMDETGIIIGHTDITQLEIGNIIMLKNCAIWKLEENQLNIIKNNLYETIN